MAMKNLQFLKVTVLFMVLIIASCRREEIDQLFPEEWKQVEKLIRASEGGLVETSDSIKLSIPPGALPSDLMIFVGRTGNEPKTVPNKNLKVLCKPITVRIPADSILKPVNISFNRPSGKIDSLNCLAFIFNGSTYFPIEYSYNDIKISAIIDEINWVPEAEKGDNDFSDLIIYFAKSEQVPPENELGLNKVSLDAETGAMSFGSPGANSSSRILILVHGWTGDASTWRTFLPKILKETNPKYSEIWTFVYNSSFGIAENARKFAGEVKAYSKGAHIDIVAHSMGGLVSRSMIEQFNGAAYINRLITVGSPHKGSPLAVFRYIFGELVKLDDKEDYSIYNYNTQGFRDLNTFSAFITELNKITKPAIPYYSVAAVNATKLNPFSIYVSNFLLSGPDDGIVEVSSAKGCPGVISNDPDIRIDEPWAHLEMPHDEDIYNRVLKYLRLGKPLVETSSVQNPSQNSANVGGTVRSDGGATVTERGVYWGQSQNPETTGTKLQIGSGTGPYSTVLNGLDPGATYYIKGYAINSLGIGYGEQRSFTTPLLNNPPSVPTGPTPSDGAASVSNSPTLSWRCSDPDGDDLAYDIYFGTNSNAMVLVAANRTSNSFSRSGLSYNTRYFWKIIARDSKGYATEGPVWYFYTMSAPAQTGSIKGIVRDANTSSPLSEVTLNVYISGNLISSGTSQSDGRYEIDIPGNNGYLIVFSKPGYINAEYQNVNVTANTSIVLEPVLQIDQVYSGNGNISGSIKNALDGTGIPTVSLRIRRGINVTSGTITSSVTTTNTGTYSFSGIPAGNYTVEASKPNFNTTFFNVICLGGRTISNQDATMSPVLGSGETRIVLTWGAVPADLDSHLTGPLADGSRFHMFFYYAGTYLSNPWPGIVMLDLDDRNSYGPETTTLLQQITGVYRFSVHDYSNSNSSSSTALSNSGAQVKVYRNDGLVATFNIPPNTGGTLWTVFEMTDETIVPVNSMSYVSNPENVAKGEYVNPDMELFRTLPDKSGKK